MKIGFVLDDRLDKPDGVQQYVKLLGSWLTADGHEVHYLVGESPRTTHQNVHHLSRTVNVKFNKNRMAIPLPANKKNIHELLARDQFDILHVQMPYSPLLAGRVVAAAGPHTAVVGTFHILPHGKISSTGTKVLSAVLKKNKQRFDGFISVSAAAQVFAASHFGINSTVLPNVVDLKHYEKGRMLKKYADKQNIIFLGRLVERKGAPYLLDAYSRLVEKYPEMAATTRLIICGTGPERLKLAQAAKVIMKNYAAEITFAGFLKEEDKPDYLASAAIAVFPSTGGESFGIVLIEAMAAGAGVTLGGDNPGYRSVIGSVPRTIIDPKNAESFAMTLHLLLKDKELAEHLHAEQQTLVKQFDVDHVAPKIVHFYETALAKREHKRDT